MNHRVINTGSVNLEALEAGAGGRPLLAVHGFGGAKEDFADHLDALASRGLHVVAADHRGHGTSDHPPGGGSYSLSTFAADMVAVADALGWGRFALLGHSMGGMVAQLVAIDHTERLIGLILMDTSHGPPDGIDPETVALGRALVSEGGLQLLVRLQREQGLDPLATPAHRRLVETKSGYAEFGDRKTLACSPEMWLALATEIAITQPDRLDRLASLRVPTLVVQGEQDTPFVAHGVRMAKAIPGARLVTIPDAGHSPQFENPHAWFAAVTEFLDAL